MACTSCGGKKTAPSKPASLKTYTRKDGAIVVNGKPYVIIPPKK